jgi:hypothetical protein
MAAMNALDKGETDSALVRFVAKTDTLRAAVRFISGRRA